MNWALSLLTLQFSQLQRSEARPPQMARPPHLEGPATPQRASASFFTEASGNSRVVNIYGDLHSTCEGLDCAEMHSQIASLLQIVQRLEKHAADLEELPGRFPRDVEAQTSDGGNTNTITIVVNVNRIHLGFCLFY
ncbi:hypothetical protein FIBSPDRAFT_505381 [Athelia psychrophila]|uniref:Uncharacterized protein n=1 Tax=Athelia psychrophila TaxID=1759441 RepID=A0A167TPG5_9AGAM|nr:hypothetical protein FIBSPDRAFT_505381 [Fibularhizoctonia sp. CBS 109695]